MVIMYILIFIILLFNLDILFPRIFRGKLVMKMKRPKLRDKLGATLMWGTLMIAWSSSLITDIIRYKENSLYTINEFSVYWVVFCFFQVIRAFKAIEIREKGIFVNDGFFFKFNNINFYTLKSQDIMKINYNGLLKEDKNYELKFKDQEEALKFEEILQNYVKKG